MLQHAVDRILFAGYVTVNGWGIYRGGLVNQIAFSMDEIIGR